MIFDRKPSFALGLVVLLSVMFSAGHFSSAEDASDFKKAAAEKGCKSIPYSGLQNECVTKQQGVEEWCKEEKYSCKNPSLGTKAFIAAIEGMGEKLKDLDDKRHDLDSQMSSASGDDKSKIAEKVEANKKERDELSDRRDKMKSKLSADIEDIKKRIENGERCLEYRTSVQQIFASAKSRANDDKSRPEIKEDAEKLIADWQSEEKRHQDEIDRDKEAIQFCKDARDGKE